MTNPATLNHYGQRRLTETILAALTSAGRDPATITMDDLAPIEELHVRGRKATVELAGKLALQPDSQVLDIGSGIGGAARYLAETYGCSVIGIDLNFEYCQAATALEKLAAFSGRTSYLQGNATTLPFAAESFDYVWTVHTAMNIRDKELFYDEIRRVLKPGGSLALYDILSGDGGEIHTPVPWAKVPSHSHLSNTEELRRLLAGAGFSIKDWHDATAEGRLWFSRLAARHQKAGAEPLSVQLLFGSDFPEMARNQVRNLTEERIVLIECIAVRQG